MPRRALAPITLALSTAALVLAGAVGAARGAAIATPAYAKLARTSASSSHAPIGLPRGAVVGPSVEIAMRPVGLSIEYPLMARYLGTGACPPPALVAELLKLGSPPIRLGGDSQDFTAPSTAAIVPPASWEAAVMYKLPSEFWSQMHCLVSATKEPLTVGIDARIGELAWAEQMVAAAEGATTAGVNFSIGNEPDLYSLPEYLTSGSAGSDEAEAVNQYLRVATYLRRGIGNVPLLGPDLARPTRWRRQLPRILATLHESVLGVHSYPLSECDDPRIVTVPTLLSSFVAEAPRRLAWAVADADAAHVPAIISESNSVSCGGKAGVSDSPAAAVWALRFVLNALETGFEEVRFHSSGRFYDPFIDRDGSIIERPIATALAALNRWLPIGSSLRMVSGVRRLVVTELSGGEGSPRLILDNEQRKPESVVLGSLHSLTIQILSPARPGLLTAVAPASRGRVKLTLAPNRIVAVM